MTNKKNNDSNKNKKGSYMTRRTMLKTLGGLTAGAFGSTLLPSCEKHMPDNVKCRLKECDDDSTGTGNGNGKGKVKSLDDVEHVVLLMQENRSFDHYFGTLSGVRGFNDPNAMKLENGQSVFHQPYPQHSDKFLLPFHLNTQDTKAQAIKSTSHAWSTQHNSWNKGKIDNWIPAHRRVNKDTAPYVMGYYKREDIPFQYALADAFTICDEYHSSMLSSTWPNRTMFFTGTIDPEGKGGGPMISNHVPKEGFRWTTYAERLLDAGVSWQVYQQKNNYSCNALEFFKTFREADENSQLYKRGVAYGSANQFETDAKLDRLPKVSWIIPTSYQSEHPAYLPAEGAAFVASKINAIASNKELWEKTIFILNFDENDGLFDHVAPPVPEPGTKDEFVNSEPIGAGWRVPCIVISPWSAGGWVNSEPFDHTSVLQFLEKFTGVKEPNISDWRRDTFGDLTSTLRFDDSDEENPSLPSNADTQQQLTRAKYEVKNYPYPDVPGSKQTPPTQESGSRPHDS
jgi:phospholipase C